MAEAQVRQAAEQVREARVTLGLPPDPPDGGSPADVPADLNQTFSGVRQALAELIQTMAQVGLPLAASEATPSQFLAEFRKLDAEGNVDRIFAKLVPDAPAVKQAQAKLAQARRDLALAELDLRYCEVRAEIDGVVGRRTVNPGQPRGGRPADDVRPVAHRGLGRLPLQGDPTGRPPDRAPGRPAGRRLPGPGVPRPGERVRAGTGASLAVLPPENATGNFVKIVQRLTVRVDLAEPNPPGHPARRRAVRRPGRPRPGGPDRAGRRVPAPARRAPD